MNLNVGPPTDLELDQISEANFEIDRLVALSKETRAYQARCAVTIKYNAQTVNVGAPEKALGHVWMNSYFTNRSGRMCGYCEFFRREME